MQKFTVYLQKFQSLNQQRALQLIKRLQGHVKRKNSQRTRSDRALHSVVVFNLAMPLYNYKFWNFKNSRKLQLSKL